MLMMTGVLPDSAFVDKTVMNRTFDAVLLHWDLQSLWGWDFPMMALVAAALGRQEDALRLLLLDNPRNRYLANGHNEQGDDDALPLYLPGNAALLLVTALMAKKGMFPSNWAVRAEGLGDYVW
jgi:hypothetical protein